MMKYEYLNWDSDFFGRRIGRVIVDEAVDEAELANMLKEWGKEYDLLYVFCSKPLTNAASILGMKLVDEKVVYAGKVTIPVTLSDDIMPYDSTILTPALECLAWVSAGHSRYKTDERFGEDYKRLYTRWIENSINGQMADVVLCHYNGTELDGMLTLQLKDGYGDIGLVAVDPACHSKGIGTQLMQYAYAWLLQRQVEMLHVATQRSNVQACRYYEKQGMEVYSLTYVYHYWTH